MPLKTAINMERVLLVAASLFIVAGAASCKKDYTCICTGPNTDDEDVVLVLKDIRKNETEDVCNAAGSPWINAGYTCTVEQ